MNHSNNNNSVSDTLYENYQLKAILDGGSKHHKCITKVCVDAHFSIFFKLGNIHHTRTLSK